MKVRSAVPEPSPPRHLGLEVALVLLTFVVSFAFSYGPGALRMTLPGALAISTAAAGAVWLSGRRPAAALVLTLVLALGLPVLRATFEAMDLVVVLVVFQAALGTRLRPWLLAAACLLALSVHDAWQRVAFDRTFLEPSVLYPLVLTAGAVGLGLQSRRVRVQHRELVALRDADRSRAVADERRRIARDLHDVAAHHLSALVVHNKLARRLRTLQALDEAAAFTAETASDTLEALRQVVHVMHADGEAPRAPQPGLAELERVLLRMEAAGLQIERGPGPVLPAHAGVEVAVVRIAQEALANVLRHRGPGRCWLDVGLRGGAVTVVVEDDGPRREPPPARPVDVPAGRYGLLGMRERAEACGGHLTVGPSPRGGWRVSAVLPLPAT